MATFDLVIRGGSLVDGTGTEPRTADVAVRGGMVIEVGRVDGTSSRTIDADGLLVTPGFVDIHAHYDGQALWDDRLSSSTSHGVTTLVAGNCGVGFAPARSGDREALIELMEGVEDIPGTALHEGLSWEWETFPEYLDVLATRSWDADLGIQVPHAPLRVFAMQDRAVADEPATPEDIEVMASLAAEGIGAGALGFSTSRTRAHRSSRGTLTPTLTAESRELLGIARAVGATGCGVLQLVSDFHDLEAELLLVRRMAEVSERPVSFSMSDPFGLNWKRQLEFLDECALAGLPILGQAGTRAIGVLLGLGCSIHPFQGNEVYDAIAHHDCTEQARIMSDRDFKAKVLAAPTPPARGTLADFSRLFEFGDPPDYEPPADRSIASRAEREGRSPLDVTYDVLIEDSGRRLIYVPLINWFDGSLDAVGEMLSHPRTVPGLSDGGAHVGTICDASFPTTMITKWARDRSHGRIPLAEAVRRQTRDTARAVGLYDRGVIAPGYRADLNLIDFERLGERAPEVRHDLPAGGSRLVQGADGYVATFVRGVMTQQSGAPTDARPGRLLRGAQPAPVEHSALADRSIGR